MASSASSFIIALRSLRSLISKIDPTTLTGLGLFHCEVMASTSACRLVRGTILGAPPGSASPLRYFDTRLSARSILASRCSRCSALVSAPSISPSFCCTLALPTRDIAPSRSSWRFSDMERSRDRIGFSMRLFTSLVSFSLATTNSASAALASTPVALRNLLIAARASSSALAMLSCGRPYLSYAAGRSSCRISSVRWLLSISPRSRAASISAVSSCTIDVATVGFAESVS